MSDALYEEANELMLNDEYEQALKVYSTAIEKCEPTNISSSYTYYIGRSQAHLKLKNNKDALSDAEFAISLNPTDSRAYLKKGISLYNLKEYQKSFDTLLEGQKKAENESETKRNLFNDWISKCKKELPDLSALKENLEKITQTKLPPSQPSIKYEWYQTESQVTVTILAKNLTQEDLSINVKENTLSIQSKDQEKYKIDFNFNLCHQVLPEATQIKYLTTKCEIKLKKCEALHWSKLESNPNDTVVKKVAKIETESKPYYPSSSKKPVNWDKLAAEVTAEEKDEKLEGDAALNKLFKQIYENGSDEVRKAMNKSFSESGGTVLSTNWTDVGSKKLEVKPPDGMEFKKWD